jgi:hypothetical protein
MLHLHLYACVHMWQAGVVGHPVAWQAPVTSRDLCSGDFELVCRGAQAAGSTAEAIVLVDDHEHGRRVHAGLGAVTSLGLLDVLLDFPLHAPVRMCDVGPRGQATVRLAPSGVFECDDASVTRVLSPPTTVIAALLLGTSWRRMMAEASSFAPFCQQIMLFERAPRALGSLIWEAQVAGIGVWIRDGDHVVEVLHPRIFRRRRWKAAGWRFQERAYAAWLRPKTHSASWYADTDHPSRTDSGAFCPLEPVFPGM